MGYTNVSPQSLYYKDKPMPDPLCLNDIPVDTSEDANIKVEVGRYNMQI